MAASRAQPNRNRRNGRQAEPQRRCLVTRQLRAKESLIRFVVGPDNRVTPDIAAKLPGRGIWLSADRDVVNTACERNLFAKGFRAAVSVDADMTGRVEDLVAKRCLGLLGLARRAGDVALGFEQVSEALASGVAAVGVIAVEAADNSRRKIERAAGERPVCSLFTAGELSQALGREHVIYAAVTKGRNAERLVIEAQRLAGFRKVDVVLCPGKSREGMV